MAIPSISPDVTRHPTCPVLLLDCRKTAQGNETSLARHNMTELCLKILSGADSRNIVRFFLYKHYKKCTIFRESAPLSIFRPCCDALVTSHFPTQFYYSEEATPGCSARLHPCVKGGAVSLPYCFYLGRSHLFTCACRASIVCIKTAQGVRNRGLAVFIASIVLRAGFSHLLLVSGQTTTAMATHVRVFLEYRESIYYSPVCVWD